MKRLLLKSKKGIAVESALIFMIVILSLCFLLTTLALLGHYRINRDNAQLARRIEAEQIGTYYVAYLTEDEYDDFGTYLANKSLSFDNYTLVETADEDLYTLTVKRGEAETVVLYISAQRSGDEVTLLSWRTSSPNT